MVSLTAQAVESQDVRLRQTLLTLGAGGRDLALGCLHEARFAVILAGLNAFGRVVTEVGISMMVGGNIKWDTRTITTAITLETGKGEFAVASPWGLILLFMAFVVNMGAGGGEAQGQGKIRERGVAELVYEAEGLIQVYNGREALNLPRLAVPPGSVTALTA